jgi:VCBS repeat-containing protein
MNPPANSAPIAVNDVESTNMDHPLYASVLDNDSDPDNQQLTNPVITVQPAHGSAIVLANGLIQYTPNPGYSGNDILTYQICDNEINPGPCSMSSGLCATATLTITIVAPNTVVPVNDEHSTWVNTLVSGSVMTNDYDPQGDTPLVFRGFNIGGTLFNSGAHVVSGTSVAGVPVVNAGSLNINAAGTYTFTPANNFEGVVRVPYIIADANVNAASDTAVLQLTINPLPATKKSLVANNDENTTYGSAVTNNVLVNDRNPHATTFTVTSFLIDSDGDGVPDLGGTVGSPVTIAGQTITGMSVTNAGSITLNANGAYTFTPATDFHGKVNLQYTICDNGSPAACATAILHIAILNDINGSGNDIPVVGDDFNFTPLNTAVSGSFFNNDRDPNGDQLSLSGTNIVTGGPHTLVTTSATTHGGSVQLFADGTYTYTPANGYSGPDDVTYTLCDVTATAPQPLCKTAQIHFLVAADDAPVAVNDVNSTNEDTPVSGTVVGNDTPSVDGGNTWTLIGVNGGASHGTVSMNPDGTYTYTPNANYNGTDVFTYQVCDVDGDCSTATVTITINPVDDVPVAVNDTNTTNEDTPVSGTVVGNDTPSGDGGNVWTLVGVNGGASHGTVSMNPDGTYTYTPNANYNGTDVFSYQVCDVDGDCSTATVTITINPTNDVPVAVNDTNSTNEDTPVSGTVVGNDTPSPDGGNVWTLVGVNGGASHGTVTMNPDGTYTYTPNANYNGTDVFTYQVCDIDNDCSTATVTITINPVDDVPIAVNDTNTTSEDTPVSGTVVTNDTPSGDGGNIWSLTGVNGGALHGTVTMNPDGTYTYNPNANYNGTDVFTYHVCDIDGDCSTATVTITIIPVNDVPVAVNDTNTTNEDTPVSGTVVPNDTQSGDGGNVWTLIGVNGGAAHGTVTMNPDGTYTYTPNANYNGVDVFNYRLCDVDGDCSSATVTITIIPVNDVPVAVNDTNTTNEDTPVSGTVTSNDTQSGDGGNNWSLVGINGGAAHGSVTMNPDGTYTYTPNANYHGVDVFNYTLCDVDGDCSSATVTITIISVNDVPLAVNDVNTTNEDTPVSGDASVNDTRSGDEPNTWSLIGVNGGAAHGTVVMNPDGTYTYTPNANYNGVDVFNYRVCDVDGDCSPATVTITINPVNDVPVAVNDFNTTNEDTPVSGTVVPNDTQSGDGGNVWSLIGVNGGAAHGAVTMNPDGTYTYTPDANYNGLDVFNYRLCDIDNDCSTATVTITINPGNDVPLAVNDVNTTDEDTPVTANASINDTPSPDGGNEWSLRGINGGATHGTVTMSIGGVYTYTPATNFHGVDVFSYQVCDVDNDCSTATVTITILSVTDPFVTVNDENSTWQNKNVTGNVLNNDFNVVSDGQTFVTFMDPVTGNAITTGATVSGLNKTGSFIATAGTITFDASGNYNFIPASTFTGRVNIPYRVCGNGPTPVCDTAYLGITVDITPTTGNSVIANNDENVSYGSAISGNVLTNDRDPQYQGFTVTAVTGGGAPGAGFTVAGTDNSGNTVSNAGTLLINSNGTYSYTPAASFKGGLTVQYTITDIAGGTSTAQLHIDVITDQNGPSNDPPVAGDDFVYTDMNRSVQGFFYNNDSDPNNDPVSFFGVTIVPGGPHTQLGVPQSTTKGGIIQFYTDGSYVYLPPSSYTGPDYINYRICDVPGGLCSDAQIHFLVGPAFTTLPVTTLQAAAQLRGDIVTVKWNTESEVNTDYFEVERSTDNILFISLGTRVTAAGNSTGILNYSLDNDITSINQYPAIYYRVKLYGLGGETKYSNVVFVKLNQSVEITGWPNPFTSAITLNINVDQNTNLAVKLTDLAGRTICEKFQPASRGVSQLALNGLDKLANGIYMVTVTNSVTGDKTVLKFMKE